MLLLIEEFLHMRPSGWGFHSRHMSYIKFAWLDRDFPIEGHPYALCPKMRHNDSGVLGLQKHSALDM